MRRVVFAEGEFYHLYNRGVDKRVVFTERAEYRRFLAYVLILNDTESVRADNLLRNPLDSAFKPKNPLVAIGAFCLMPNHFHLYITPLVKRGISHFMQRLQTAYTMYFNEKHQRSGALFQGTFKARRVDTDPYARYLFSYIHLNPAKIVDASWQERGVRDLKKLRDFVASYPFSSIGEYSRGVHRVTDPAFFPKYLTNATDVDAHIDEWLSARDLTMRKAKPSS
jgi:putative transposase